MLFLGIDLGTSYFKVGLFNETGHMKGFGRFPVPVNKNNGASELLYTDFWITLNKCINTALRQANAKPEDILALSYGTQANSVILLDKNYSELTSFIIWNDERAQLNEEVASYTATESFRQQTGIGIPFSELMLLNKIKWLKNKTTLLNNDEAIILTMPDYLCLKLTGKRVVDASSFSLTGILDFKSISYINDALKIVRLHEDQLSIVKPIGTMVSACSQISELLPVNKGAIFISGGLDHHVAAIGAGVGSLYSISESTGTVIAAVDHSIDGAVKTGLCVSRGLYPEHFFRMAFNENGAVALEWYQKQFAPEYSIGELIKLAEQLPSGCEGLIAKPMANTFAGFGGFEGKLPQHHHGHFVRAIMESTARSLDNIFNKLSIPNLTEVVNTGGGAKSILWRQIKNSLTGKILTVPKHTEAACGGAAMLAATGFGLFDDIYEAQEAWLKN